MWNRFPVCKTQAQSWKLKILTSLHIAELTKWANGEIMQGWQADGLNDWKFEESKDWVGRLSDEIQEDCDVTIFRKYAFSMQGSNSTMIGNPVHSRETSPSSLGFVRCTGTVLGEHDLQNISQNERFT